MKDMNLYRPQASNYMKVLVDSCVSSKAKSDFELNNIEAEFVADWQVDPGDESILNYAVLNQVALLTLDKDFGELAVTREVKHFGIVRLANVPSKVQGRIAAAILVRYERELRDGAIIVADSEKVRLRPRFERD